MGFDEVGWNCTGAVLLGLFFLTAQAAHFQQQPDEASQLAVGRIILFFPVLLRPLTAICSILLHGTHFDLALVSSSSRIVLATMVTHPILCQASKRHCMQRSLVARGLRGFSTTRRLELLSQFCCYARQKGS